MQKAVARPFNGFEPAPKRALVRADLNQRRCDCPPLAKPLRHRLVVNLAYVYAITINPAQIIPFLHTNGTL